MLTPFMKVCLLIPVYNSTRFLPTLFNYVHKLNPKPDMTFFCENNSNDSTLEYIVHNYKLPYKIIRIWFRKDATKVSENVYDTIAHARQLLLTAARHYNPDYAIFLDSDVYPIDEDMITKLTAWNEDILGGMYIRNYPEGIFVASKWMNMNNKFLLKKPQSLTKPLDAPFATSGGCLCLSNRVIQDRRLDFYPIIDWRGASEDYGYCIKARNLGYQIFLDTVTKIRHDNMRTTERMKPWTKSKGEYVSFEY